MSTFSPPLSKGTYSLVTLGCPKNLVDSERMAGLLRLDGYQFVRDVAEADFVVVNTCGFLAAARQESFSAIRDMLHLKKRGKLRGVIVSGCLAQRDKETLLQQYPEIDQVVGVFGRDAIATAVGRLFGSLDEQRTVFHPAPARPLPDNDRLRITPQHLAYLKISEGCNRTCSFCTIPSLRGKHASKPIEDVVAEARQLAAEGVRELIIVAQDTTYYGIDLYGGPKLAELLVELEQIPRLEWIRLMYLYPMYLSDGLIDVLAEARKILPYLDIPLQHINDDVLRRMRRRVGRQRTEELLGALRSKIPHLALRTTFIAGFPGETEAQFEELLEFVVQQQFQRLGAFVFSPEPGTPAIDLDGQLPDEVRKQRRDRLLEAQQKIAFAWNEKQVGRRLDVLIDSEVPDQPGAYLGRTYADAPEIDGAVYVTADGLLPGQIVGCEIVAAQGYDLIAVAVDAPR
jgi:ribosomal protein S12 methylthiotransferase